MQGCYLDLILTLAQGAEPEAVENPRSGMLLGGPRAALGLAGAFAKRTFAKRTPRWDLQERAYLMLLQSRARVARFELVRGDYAALRRGIGAFDACLLAVAVSYVPSPRPRVPSPRLLSSDARRAQVGRPRGRLPGRPRVARVGVCLLSGYG